MANLQVKDANGTIVTLSGSGAGSEVDPIRLEKIIYPIAGTLVDRSGTITTASQSQDIMGSNPERRYLLIQNNSKSPLWINFGTNAVMDQPSIQLLQNGGSIVMEGSFVSTQSISIIGSIAGQSFTAKEG